MRAAWLDRALFALAAVSLAVSLGVAPKAHAIMATPQDKFSVPSKNTIRELRAVDALRPYLKAENSLVRFQKLGFEDASIFIFRICREAEDDWCNTAFFLNEISDEQLSGIGYFPRKTTIGCVWRTDTMTGEQLMPLLFVDSIGTSKNIWLSKDGVLF